LRITHTPASAGQLVLFRLNVITQPKSVRGRDKYAIGLVLIAEYLADLNGLISTTDGQSGGRITSIDALIFATSIGGEVKSDGMTEHIVAISGRDNPLLRTFGVQGHGSRSADGKFICASCGPALTTIA
jgi:hypothetical protein